MKIYKKILLPSLISAILFLTSASYALADDSKYDLKKIGVVDFQQVLQSYHKVKEADEKLKKQFAPQQEKLVDMRKQLNNDVDKYNRDSGIMKEADKKSTEAKIRDEANKLQTAQSDFQKQLAAAKNETMKSIEQDVADIVGKVAKDLKLDLVLAKAAVGYSDSKFDITDQVVKKLKK
jgi:outer membrane protein